MMITSQLFTSAFMFLASVIMFLAVLRTKQILSLLREGKYVRDWRVLFALSVFFLIGYCGMLYFVLADMMTILVPASGVILLSGASYVYLVTRTGSLTIDNLFKTSISRDYLDNVLTSMNEALIVINPEAGIQTVNRATCQLLGYAEAELVGKPVGKICAGATHDVDKVIQKGFVQNVERQYLTKSGKKIPVLMSCSTMNDETGKARGIVCVAQDITERKRAEETLRESEKRYHDLIESSHDMVQSIFPDGRFEFVNKSWFETLEYTESDLSDLTLFDIIPPDFHPHCRDLISQIMAGQSFNNIEIDFVTKSGCLIPVEGNVTGRYMHGEFVATHGFFRDITERKRAEMLSEKHRQELEQKVEVRTQELKEKNETLENTLQQLKDAQSQLVVQEKMAYLGALTAGIAHEIKNPLNFVNNFAELSIDLIQELSEEIDLIKKKPETEALAAIEDIMSDLRQNVSKINEHGTRANNIVDSMLLHSRGKTGERQQTNINAMLEQDLNLAYHGMRAKDSGFNVTIERAFDDTLGNIEVVPQDISRVFLNVIDNGFYAAHHRKSKSQGNEFTPTLLVQTRNYDDQVEVQIRDNGSGIPKEMLDKVFDPFFTSKPAGEGTGLGLSISYDIIVQGHGGEIRVETEEGSYTEFIITLPKVRNPDPKRAVVQGGRNGI